MMDGKREKKMWEKLRGREKDWLKDRRSGSKKFFFLSSSARMGRRVQG